MPRTLLEARIVFSSALAHLFAEANALGLDWIVDEVKRSPLQAKWNATHCRVMVAGKRCEQLDMSHTGGHTFKPIGLERSVHVNALAVDLLFIQHGRIMDDPTPYAQLAEKWKALDPELRWGGDFAGFADLGHFSHEWQGRK